MDKRGIAAAIGMGILILDTRTALAGAAEGLDLCIKTIIPSLLPFFLLSNILTSSLSGTKAHALAPVCRLCKIPEGAQSLFLIGLVGGYPVGAQCVCQAYQAGSLSKKDAERMIVFCNNCGPAFLFGIVAHLFRSPIVCLVIWAIQLVSAVITAWILLSEPSSFHHGPTKKSSPLEGALRSMAIVCVCIISFKVGITYLERWICWYLPVPVRTVISAVLEISNGCISLASIDDPGLRFLLCVGMLSFGGVCVMMQTFSILPEGLGKRLYFPGKMLQCSISVILAWLVLLPSMPQHPFWCLIPGSLAAMLTFFLRKTGNKSSIPARIGV